MPTKFALHKQQLFHWIGGHIDSQKLSREKSAELYIEALRGSLENGLWVNSPREPEEIWRGGKAHSLELPMVCFTEWSLGQSFAHTQRYGRMGLGFSRKWVMQKHGQPVTYFKNNNRSKYKQSCAKLLKASGRWSDDSRKALEYLIHFAKPSQAQVIATPPTPSMPSSGRGKPSKSTKRPKPDPFWKSHGASMKFMEEREWRIVRDKRMRFFTENPSSKTNAAPDYFLPYTPGRHLYTLVLPDGYTVHRVLQDTPLRKQLFPNNQPQVAVMSLEDIGTF